LTKPPSTVVRRTYPRRVNNHIRLHFATAEKWPMVSRRPGRTNVTFWQQSGRQSDRLCRVHCGNTLNPCALMLRVRAAWLSRGAPGFVSETVSSRCSR
jgi:hypothetical protein